VKCRKSTNAANSSRQLLNYFPGDKKLKIINGNSHGTDMFLPESGIMDKLVAWAIIKMK